MLGDSLCNNDLLFWLLLLTINFIDFCILGFLLILILSQVLWIWFLVVLKMLLTFNWRMVIFILVVSFDWRVIFFAMSFLNWWMILIWGFSCVVVLVVMTVFGLIVRNILLDVSNIIFSWWLRHCLFIFLN